MQEFYWEILLYSGETIKVRPDIAMNVQQKIATGQGAITTPTRSIIIKDIKDFRVTDRRYTDQKLIEDVSRTFNEPVYNEDGSVQAKWIKKTVPMRRWESYYKFSSGYRKLYDEDNYVVIAIFMPVHQINSLEMHPLTRQEELLISKQIG